MIELDKMREWAHNPCTESFVVTLQEKRAECLEQLGTNFHRGDEYSIQRAIGTCQSLKATIDAIQSYRKEENAE